MTMPKFSVGDRVQPLVSHMPGMKGMVGTVKIAREGDPPYYAIKFDDMDKVHKWYAEDELEAASEGDSMGAKPSTSMAFRVLSGEIPAGSAIALPDGSLWSHAATLGTRIKNTQFTIDKSTVDNFVKNFTTGYPQKVPVDYEHGTVNGATDFGQPVPKAGDVYELKGVYASTDFTGTLADAAKKLAEKAGRELADDRNYGLWIRWRPTARALRMITDREYSELSISFAENLPHNVTGAGQGPTLLSIALTNLPFLDDMLPVAASRSRTTPASPDQPSEESLMNKFFNALSARFGKPVGTEEEATSALESTIDAKDTQIRELSAHKSYSDVVAAEIGETDPVKAIAAIRTLKQQATAATTASEEATTRANETAADQILTANEKRIGTVALKAHFRTQLLVELKAGKKPGETETEKVIATLPEATSLTQKSTTDIGAGDAPTDRDSLIEIRAQALKAERPDLVKLAEKDERAAYKKALAIASSEIPRTTPKK